MEYRLSRDEKLYIASRALLLICMACLVYADVLKPPVDITTVVIVSGVWVILTSGLLLNFFSRFTAFSVHVIDLIMLGFTVLANGGNACFVAYLFPLCAITVAMFVGRGYALIVSTAVILFDMYLLLSAGRIKFTGAAFWVAYCAGSLFFAYYLLALREIRHLRFLSLETESREKQLEKNLHRLEEKINAQSVVDEVTGLKNFRYFRERIETEVKRAARQKYILSLCVMSVDGLEDFKQRNGAADCDHALNRITKQLEKMLRDTDLISRFQSNQFLFLLPDTDPRKAIVPARRIRDALCEISFGSVGIQRFDFSFGIAGFPADAQTVGGLISLATASLERSHKRGRSQITLASSLARNITG